MWWILTALAASWLVLVVPLAVAVGRAFEAGQRSERPPA